MKDFELNVWYDDMSLLCDEGKGTERQLLRRCLFILKR